MKFEDHLGEFLGDSVGRDEARQLAIAAVAGSLRRIKLAIAEQVWQARQVGIDSPDAGAGALAAARALKARFDMALGEYRRLNGETEMGSELRVIKGGQDAGAQAHGPLDGGA